MPIEIRELVIKATVEKACENQEDSGEPCPDEKENIVAECVDRVLQVLKDKLER
jgi:hypothetical protein